MIDTETIGEIAYEMAHRDSLHRFGYPEADFREKPIWQKLRALGTRLWLDTADSDEAEELWCSEFEALTTNNTLLNREIRKGIYDELMYEVVQAIRQAVPDVDEQRLILETGFVLNAHHGLRLAETFDAHVSVELHTDLGNDVTGSVAYGERYFDVCPERFCMKAPLTPAGLLAARRLGHAGVPVNLTLGFSARQSYLAILLAQPRFVNVFMGPLNAFVVRNGLGDGRNLGEKAALATQRELLRLREAGRTHSLLIGASTDEGAQVPALAGLDVLTMSTEVALQYEAKPAGQLSSQVRNDPPVQLAEGVFLSDLNAATLWDVPKRFKDSVDELLNRNVDDLEPEDLQAYFARAGFPDLLPQWSDDDICNAATDGKTPVFDRWKDRLTRGEIGLDALMNLCAFQSSATDQKALDDRIRSLI